MSINDRCPWPGSNPLMIAYHDEEWGVPLHDDQKIFEFMTLDAFQAGLSWQTIINKRENFRKAFHGFDVDLVAGFGDEDFNRLMEDAGIVRNRAKIQATINNAKLFREIQAEYGSFDQYIWKFVNGRPVVNSWTSLSELPARTPLSDSMSKELQKRGFKFVGSTICYAFMQAAGMVNDHLTFCSRYHEINNMH